jgi:hypothetical protein
MSLRLDNRILTHRPQGLQVRQSKAALAKAALGSPVRSYCRVALDRLGTEIADRAAYGPGGDIGARTRKTGRGGGNSLTMAASRRAVWPLVQAPFQVTVTEA